MDSVGALRRFRVGDWEADAALDEIRAPGQLVKMEPRTMRLLCVLAERPGEVWSAEELLERVWPGVMVTYSSVYQAVAQLRRVLGDDGAEARYVATVPRKGYRLVAKVTRLPDSPEAPSPPATPGAEPRTPPGERRRASDKTRRRLLVAGALFALAVLLATGAWWWLVPGTPPSAPAVAVLPFADLSPAGDRQRFCDGLTDELTNALARIPGLRVTGRNSAFQFRGREIDARTVGKTLGVTHVIVGSVRHNGERVRIIAQLVNTSTGFQVWQNNYDRPRSDALAIQTEISRAVAEALELQLGHEERGDLERRSTTFVNAYDLYLLGRHQQLQRNVEALDRAIAHYQQAIAADPRFALAHAGLADAYMARYYYGNQTLSETTELVQAEVDAALRLDPELAEAYAAWSVLLVELRRRGEAINALRRALSINPNYGEAYLRLGFALEYDGQLLEALKAYDQVAVLDPLNTILHVRRCLLLPMLGRYVEAEAACQRGFELQPELPNALWAHALLQIARGDLASAVGHYRAALSRAPMRADIRSELALIYMDLGMTDEAMREIAEVRARAPSTYIDLIEARVYLLRKDFAGLKRFLQALRIEADDGREQADAAMLALAIGDDALARRLSPREPILNGEAEDLMMPSVYDTRWSLCAMCSRALVENAHGDMVSARRHVDRMLGWLAGFEKQGGQWHGLHFTRAMLLAQNGDVDGAFAALQAAVDRGWRRTWLLGAHPAFAAMRSDARFARLQDIVAESNAAARAKLTDRATTP